MQLSAANVTKHIKFLISTSVFCPICRENTCNFVSFINKYQKWLKSLFQSSHVQLHTLSGFLLLHWRDQIMKLLPWTLKKNNILTWSWNINFQLTCKYSKARFASQRDANATKSSNKKKPSGRTCTCTEEQHGTKSGRREKDKEQYSPLTKTSVLQTRWKEDTRA